MIRIRFRPLDQASLLIMNPFFLHLLSGTPAAESQRHNRVPSVGQNVTTATAFITLSPRDFDAVLFDLDGVLTKTADVHAAAWKRLFDKFLESRSNQASEPFVPFDIDTDYRRYVDGKPRLDGVATFLKSRGIDLPVGTPEDDAGPQTMHGLGNLKDHYFLEHLKERGVERYEASTALVRAFGERTSKRQSMIPKSEYRFSEKIMLKHGAKAG